MRGNNVNIPRFTHGHVINVEIVEGSLSSKSIPGVSLWSLAFERGAGQRSRTPSPAPFILCFSIRAEKGLGTVGPPRGWRGSGGGGGMGNLICTRFPV